MKESIIMKKEIGLKNYVLELIIICFIICAILNLILFFIEHSVIYVILSLVSLLIIGITIFILSYKSENKVNILDNYVILTKEEYTELKNKLYNQKLEIKNKDKIIKELRTLKSVE